MYKCNLIVMITLGPKDTLCLSRPTQKLIVYKLNDKNESTFRKVLGILTQSSSYNIHVFY